jgi:hypothetical protein
MRTSRERGSLLQSATTLADLITPFTDAIAEHRALPPDQKNRARASGGAGLIAFCLYVLIAVPQLPVSSWVAFVLWLALIAFGALWLVVGIKGSTGPRDIMAGFWSGIGILFFLGLMVVGAYLPADWVVVNFLLKGFYIGYAAACVVKLWVSARGIPSTGLDEVRAQQAHGRARDATEAETAARLGATGARAQRRFQD